MGSFENKLWDEWSAMPYLLPVEDEMAGILDGLNYSRKGKVYTFRCARIFTVKRLMCLWLESEYQKDDPCGASPVYTSKKTLYGFCTKEDTVAKIFARSLSFKRRNRNWNWLRGLWGACGSLYIPKSGYHLVMRLPGRNNSSERVAGILRSAGFSPGLRKRSGAKELMLRDQQQIATFLSRLGFTHSVLSLEETAIFRSVRNHANKVVNCDAANINKSLDAARAQLALIKELEDLKAVEDLPEPLKELVFARKNNPSASLRELGQSLSRPISKSTVEYRWRRLESIMRDLVKGDG